MPLNATAPETDVGLLRVAGHTEGKQPWYFSARDGSSILTAAGLWDSWKNPEIGRPLLSCTMIITEPNALVAAVHDRMPVLVTEKQFEPWLRATPASSISNRLATIPLQKPVSKRVNSSKARPTICILIERIETAPD